MAFFLPWTVYMRDHGFFFVRRDMTWGFVDKRIYMSYGADFCVKTAAAPRMQNMNKA
jgi:hypothetical protein